MPPSYNGWLLNRKLNRMAEQFQDYQHNLRELTDDERARLQNDCVPVSDFKKNKLEKDAQRNWDLFYKRNSTNFFKDRHWTCREFQELCADEGTIGWFNNLSLGNESKCIYFVVSCSVNAIFTPWWPLVDGLLSCFHAVRCKFWQFLLSL